MKEKSNPKHKYERDCKQAKPEKKHTNECKEWEGRHTTTNNRKTKNEKHYNKSRKGEGRRRVYVSLVKNLKICVNDENSDVLN